MRRRWFAAAASLVAVSLVVWLVAAGGGSNRTPSATTTSGQPPADRSATGSPGRVVISDTPGPQLGFNVAANYVHNPSTKTGGTLRLLAGSDCDSWDPGRTALGWCWNMQRLISRTLVAYTLVSRTDVELSDGSRYKLAPDLATSLGRHNSNYTQWTFTLQQGLKFANGEPITPDDIKYGIERSPTSNVIRNHLDSITTTGNSITFTLSRPNGGFDYLLALPAAAPVPVGGRPVASGPFEIQSYTQNKQMTLVRNPDWSQSTDGIRHPLVDKVVLTIDSNVGDIDRRLLAGTVDARADSEVQGSVQSQILTNPDLKKNADDPILAATRYLAVIPSVIPNVHCRRAIFYAWNKAAAVRVFGGPTAGVAATSMTPPGIEGYDPSYNPYPSGPDQRGDVAKARQELRACGKPNGFTTSFVYLTPSETGPFLFRAEARALGRVGIKLVPRTTGTYYQVATPKQLTMMGVGLVEESVEPQVPTAYPFYAPFLRYHSRSPSGLTYGPLDDPVVQHVLTESRMGRATDVDWERLDHAVMADAVYLPFLWERALYYRNPRLTNVTCDDAVGPGIYDFVNVGVR